ncbi:hypothetical protein E9993_21090 [Labilibacter sediminis]|nr:hypothetical protein E9993_21090 [Labilibacter sediminis]
MKSKQSIYKKSKRSTSNGPDERNGLRPVKSNNGKSKNKISIYDNLEDDFDELNLNNYLNDFDEKLDDFED